MIAFDLCCNQDHTFEAWFQDSQAFKEQLSKGLIECPVCGSREISKVPSAVAVHIKSGSTPKQHDSTHNQAILELLHEAYEYIEKHTEDVGPAFAEEALKMHYGVTEQRSIRGVATEEEEKMLEENGIKFSKIPVPLKKQKNKGH